MEKLNKIGDDLIEYEIRVKKRKSTRSLEQNSRLWALYRNIGDFIGVTDDDMHEYMGNKFLKYVRTINGEDVISIESTTKLDTKRMADYQEKIQAWAATELGWSWQDE
jgi:hypothetical protein